MESEIIFSILAIAVCVVASGFFAGAETAVTHISQARLFNLMQNGDKRANKIAALLKDKESLIGSLLLGNSAVHILGSAMAASLAIKLWGEEGVFYASAIMTVITPRQPRAYFLQGHSEHPPDSDDGLSGYAKFAGVLRENSVLHDQLTLDGPTDVPAPTSGTSTGAPQIASTSSTGNSSAAAPAEEPEIQLPKVTIRRETPKVGRNDPCPCGSGKKFKNCHGA